MTVETPQEPTERQRGVFISFEGMDGVGKSTQVGRLVDWFKSQGKRVLLVREPGGTPLCENIRDLIKTRDPGESMSNETEALLINASRAQLVRKVILPALEDGVHVVSDRFYDSTIAYQAFGRGMALDPIRELIQFATGGLRPDITFYLHLDKNLRKSRLQARDGESGLDRFETAGEAFFDRIEAGFQWICQEESDRVHKISAEGSQEEVFERTLQKVLDLINIASFSNSEKSSVDKISGPSSLPNSN